MHLYLKCHSYQCCYSRLRFNLHFDVFFLLEERFLQISGVFEPGRTRGAMHVLIRGPRRGKSDDRVRSIRFRRNTSRVSTVQILIHLYWNAIIDLPSSHKLHIDMLSKTNGRKTRTEKQSKAKAAITTQSTHVFVGAMTRKLA